MPAITQMGSGLNSDACDLLHLYLRAIIDYAEVRSVSNSFIFVDVSTAFAAMDRAIAATPPGTEADLHYWLLEQGFTSEIAEQVLQAVSAFKSGLAASMSPLVAQQFYNAHQRAWETTEGLPTASETHTGTLAGHALGDLAFNITMSCILKLIYSRLRYEGLVSEIDTAAAKATYGSRLDASPDHWILREASFVDDCVFPIYAAAENITAATKRAMEIINATFSQFKLTLNYKNGNTEAMLFFHDPQVATIKRELYAMNGNHISFVGAKTEQQLPRVVSSYKHVGTTCCVSGTLGPEISYRANTMKHANTILKKSLFSNPKASLETKVVFAKAVLLTKNSYNAGTWPILNKAEAKRFHTAVMSIYKNLDVSSYSNTNNISHREIIAQTGLTSLLVALRLQRLHLFVRAVVSGPISVLIMITEASAAKRSWIRAIITDLKWYSERSSEYPYEDDRSIHQWAQEANSSKKVRRDIYKVCNDYDNNSLDPSGDAPVNSGLHKCSVCDHAFSTKQQLAVHEFAKHGVLSSVFSHKGTYRSSYSGKITQMPYIL